MGCATQNRGHTASPRCLATAHQMAAMIPLPSRPLNGQGNDAFCKARLVDACMHQVPSGCLQKQAINGYIMLYPLHAIAKYFKN